MKHLDVSTQVGRRQFTLGLMSGAAACTWPLRSAQAQSVATVAGKWRINGNGHDGELEIYPTGSGELTGKMYGEDVRGFYASGTRQLVLLRGNWLRPRQAFVATLQVNGLIMQGRFWALTAGAGATSSQNVFGFAAHRDTLGTYPSPIGVSLDPPSIDCMVPNFIFYNRPREFPMWTMPLQINAPGSICIGGESGPQVEGWLGSDTIYGHYAWRSASLAFVRLTGGVPTQFYVGRVVQNLLAPQRIVGSFHALTPGMGAFHSRNEYDWRAEAQ